jgi:hypothetical protein
MRRNWTLALGFAVGFVAVTTCAAASPMLGELVYGLALAGGTAVVAIAIAVGLRTVAPRFGYGLLRGALVGLAFAVLLIVGFLAYLVANSA